MMLCEVVIVTMQMYAHTSAIVYIGNQSEGPLMWPISILTEVKMLLYMYAIMLFYKFT